jgi:RNA polymerase-binding protein DksA
LANQARERIADIDAALARLADGSYGGCEQCGRPIGAERLAARPATRLCLTCAARRRS